MTRDRDDNVRGIDALIRSTARDPHIKTSYYLRPDQMELLDQHQVKLRSAGLRTANASLLMRAALDLAQRHPDEWGELIRASA